MGVSAVPSLLVTCSSTAEIFSSFVNAALIPPPPYLCFSSHGRFILSLRRRGHPRGRDLCPPSDVSNQSYVDWRIFPSLPCLGRRLGGTQWTIMSLGRALNRVVGRIEGTGCSHWRSVECRSISTLNWSSSAALGYVMSQRVLHA